MKDPVARPAMRPSSEDGATAWCGRPLWSALLVGTLGLTTMAGCGGDEQYDAVEVAKPAPVAPAPSAPVTPAAGASPGQLALGPITLDIPQGWIALDCQRGRPRTEYEVDAAMLDELMKLSTEKETVMALLRPEEDETIEFIEHMNVLRERLPMKMSSKTYANTVSRQLASLTANGREPERSVLGRFEVLTYSMNDGLLARQYVVVIDGFAFVFTATSGEGDEFFDVTDRLMKAARLP